jgi:hypothetical protein
MEPHDPHDEPNPWRDISDPFRCPGRVAAPSDGLLGDGPTIGPLTPEQEAEVRAAHRPSRNEPDAPDGWCEADDYRWPCDTALVLATLDAARPADPAEGRPPLDPLVAAHDRGWSEGYIAGRAAARPADPGGLQARPADALSRIRSWSQNYRSESRTQLRGTLRLIHDEASAALAATPTEDR